MGFKLDNIYQIFIKKQGKGTQDRIFKGKLIQETSKFITIESKNYTESFLKVDIGTDIKFL